MSERALYNLARAAGLYVKWIDAHGTPRIVAPPTLRAVLDGLGLAAGSDAQISESMDRLRNTQKISPRLCVADVGAKLSLGLHEKHIRLVHEDGATHDVRIDDEGGFRLPRHPGYYRAITKRAQFSIAAAPRRAFALSDVVDGKIWGPAAQIYALRGGTTAEFGDFSAMAEFAEGAAGVGAHAVAVSPVHALFGANPAQFSPYAPSTRLFLNPLYANLGHRKKTANPAALIDWPRAAARKMAALQSAYNRFTRETGSDTEFRHFVKRGGAALLSHARFEVLDAKFRKEGLTRWCDWPDIWKNPNGAKVRALKPTDRDVEFQLFLQWQAENGLANAQARAKDAGMGLGLIMDMAVGVDPAGSLAWSAPDEMLNGLQVGAPPDVFNQSGQDWGLTTFSPSGLQNNGFAGFIATLQAAMRHAGGMRLDHAMGLQRLWLIPRGGMAAEGAYLRYPVRTMLRLIALESVRNKCAVIAEDLGTVPVGFRKKIAKKGLYGMRVLWFERDNRGAFHAPESWDADAAALSTTHDLPTIAGWWSGHDIAWREKITPAKNSMCKEKKVRAQDRRKLWRAFKLAGCATGQMPPPGQPSRAIDAALAFVAQTPCSVALVPVEDFLGVRAQPNMPGTTVEYPNWRRRTTADNVFSNRVARRRANLLSRGREL